MRGKGDYLATAIMWLLIFGLMMLGIYTIVMALVATGIPELVGMGATVLCLMLLYVSHLSMGIASSQFKKFSDMRDGERLLAQKPKIRKVAE